MQARIGAGVNALDLNSIGVEVRMHPGVYRSMLERFVDADSTLSASEMTLVYYGFPFTTGYERGEGYADVTSAYDSGDYGRALEMARERLEENPLSLDLSVMALAAAEKLRARGDVGAVLRDMGMRCDLIATAILESGTGTDPRSPFVVTDVADIDRILRNVIGIDSIVDRTKVGDVLAFKVTFPGNPRRHILYFDNVTVERPSKPYNHL